MRHGISEDWHDFVDNDLETYPRDGALIEVEYESGARAQASLQGGLGGVISLHNASAEITGGTAPKRWRYLKRP
jgi:hypothetical protein